ncbi:hypothetical protein KC340_g144 [Hortaea werneckii]|nr:hypothetical protein KC340_g144 [Hortaea werneckii]
MGSSNSRSVRGHLVLICSRAMARSSSSSSSSPSSSSLAAPCRRVEVAGVVDELAEADVVVVVGVAFRAGMGLASFMDLAPWVALVGSVGLISGYSSSSSKSSSTSSPSEPTVCRVRRCERRFWRVLDAFYFVLGIYELLHLFIHPLRHPIHFSPQFLHVGVDINLLFAFLWLSTLFDIFALALPELAGGLGQGSELALSGLVHWKHGQLVFRLPHTSRHDRAYFSLPLISEQPQSETRRSDALQTRVMHGPPSFNLLISHGKKIWQDSNHSTVFIYQPQNSPDIVSREATVEPQRALLPHHFPKAVKHALVRQLAIGTFGLLLQTRLDEIKRKREERGEEAGNSTRRQGLRPRPERRILQPGLRLGEEGQLTEIERHRSHNRRIRTSPEPQHAFVPRNASQRIPDTSIIRPLRNRLQPVRLHPHQRQIRRVASHRGQSTCHQSSTSPLFKTDLAALLVSPLPQRLHESLEESDAGCGIDSLSEQSR